MKDWIIKNKWKIIGVILITIVIIFVLLIAKDEVIKMLATIGACITGSILFSKNDKNKEKIEKIEKNENIDKKKYDDSIEIIEDHRYTDQELIEKSKDIK